MFSTRIGAFFGLHVMASRIVGCRSSPRFSSAYRSACRSSFFSANASSTPSRRVDLSWFGLNLQNRQSAGSSS
jgi:hypothetical protein